MTGPDEAGVDATSGADSAGDVSAADSDHQASGDSGRDVGSDGAHDASADASDGANNDGGACLNLFNLGNPDAGGVCCCRFDILSNPVCNADGGSPSCGAGFDLHHDWECDPSACGSPCTNPPPTCGTPCTNPCVGEAGADAADGAHE